MQKQLTFFILALLFYASNSFALEAPVNLHFGNTPDWNFTVARAASRTSGVAPLSVHFNAGLTESTPEAQPFHDYEYSWDFGDPNSGTWGTSGRSKNLDNGPVIAHVYETPGTYTATMTVRDSSGIVDTATYTITVQDPDVVFSGTKTTCISTTSDFTGCPTGANHATTNSLSVLSSYTDAGERVLLRRGSSWTVSSSIAFPNNAGPVHIGAFGTCSSPDSSGRCSNAPAINVTGGDPFLNTSYKQDWRLADISFTGTSSIHLTFGTTGIKNQLFLRLSASGLYSGPSNYFWIESGTDYPDGNALVSCNLNNLYDCGIYMGAERIVVMGNTIAKNVGNEHVVRIWQGYQGVISHNILSGGVPMKHILKFHGPAPLGQPGNFFVNTSGNNLRHFTQFAVVANNVFGTSGAWSVVIGPQDDQKDERISDIIFEKNKILTDYGLSCSESTQVGAMFSGRYITVRNNIIDGTGSPVYYQGLNFSRRGVELMPLGNRVYNNTIYSRNSLSSGIGIQVTSGITGTVIRNNYISFPNFSETAVNDLSGTAIKSNNISTNTPYLTGPNNASPLLRDFSLTSSATAAIRQGYSVPVFEDYLGRVRTSPYDIGAFSF